MTIYRHPDATEYSLKLLNGDSYTLFIERVYNDNYDDFVLDFVAEIQGWFKDRDGNEVYLPRTREIVWRMRSLEDFNHMIRLLQSLRREMWFSEAEIKKEMEDAQ